MNIRISYICVKEIYYFDFKQTHRLAIMKLTACAIEIFSSSVVMDMQVVWCQLYNCDIPIKIFLGILIVMQHRNHFCLNWYM
jgi:hypothetical protein